MYTLQDILDWKWIWVVAAQAIEDLKALDEDPMAQDYEEPTSQYADSRDSAEAPAIQ